MRNIPISSGFVSFDLGTQIMPTCAGCVGGLKDTSGGTYLMLALYLALLLYELF